jgi:MFS family permease
MGEETDTRARRPGGERDEEDEQRGRWPALAICLVGGFMTVLDISIVNVALPDIRSSLGAAAGDLQWVLSGYALAFGLVLVPAGRLGDARTAAGVLQTAQRIGSAVGVAAVGAVFFGELPGGGRSSGGSSSGHGSNGGGQLWATAFERGLTVILGLVGLSLLVALADVCRQRRERT